MASAKGENAKPAKTKSARTPKPKTLKIVCTECGLDWDEHKEKTLSECVRLLRAELARRPKMQRWPNSVVGPHTYYGAVSASG